MPLQGILLACPGCSSTNRIQLERLDQGPACGRCGKRLPPITEPLELDDSTFDEVVTKSRLPLVVDFWAPWCGPCKTFAPTFLEFARANAGRVLACKVNVDQARQTAARLGIQSIPTIALFRGGRIVAREVGTVSRTVLDALLRAA